AGAHARLQWRARGATRCGRLAGHRRGRARLRRAACERRFPLGAERERRMAHASRARALPRAARRHAARRRAARGRRGATGWRMEVPGVGGMTKRWKVLLEKGGLSLISQRRLELDYVAPPWRPAWPGLLLLALALGLAGELGLRYRDARTELARLETQAGLVRPAGRPARAVPKERLDEQV